MQNEAMAANQGHWPVRGWHGRSRARNVDYWTGAADTPNSVRRDDGASGVPRRPGRTTNGYHPGKASGEEGVKEFQRRHHRHLPHYLASIGLLELLVAWLQHAHIF